MTKKKVLKQILNYFLVIIGTFILAFGAVIFLEKSNLVAGGVSGIAIIVQYIARTATGNASLLIYDYVIYGLMVLFWVIGLIFLGKDFALKTLLSTLVYMGLSTLFLRVPFFIELANNFAGAGEAGNLILCAYLLISSHLDEIMST